jgi:hypothetical protein
LGRSLRPARANSLEVPSPKITIAKWTRSVAQVVELKALSSNFSRTKKKKKKKQFKGSLSYIVRPCVKKPANQANKKKVLLMLTLEEVVILVIL